MLLGINLPRLRRSRVQSRSAPGAPPGTLVHDPEAPEAEITVIGYDDETFEERVLESVEDLVTHRDRWPMLWVNVDGVGDTKAVEALGKEFGLHPLALEDCVNVNQRPKVEEYDDHLFLVSRMMSVAGEFETEQVSLFLGEGFVITLQERPGDCFEPVRKRLREGRGRIRRAGPDYLLYALVDAIVDSYFPVLETISEGLYELENRILAEPSAELVARVYRQKRELIAIRRVMWPQADALNRMIRDALPLIKEETRIFLRDCHDHAIRIVDLVESYRDLTSSLTDFYMSAVSNRMNEVMKVLTIIATIFIPLTFVAGIYGMNFDPAASPWNMPELHWYWGYPAALAVMVLLTGGMVMFFRRKGWL